MTALRTVFSMIPAAQAVECVMSCYGHSRFRDMILSGVSRDIHQEVPFPLLLSN